MPERLRQASTTSSDSHGFRGARRARQPVEIERGDAQIKAAAIKSGHRQAPVVRLRLISSIAYGLPERPAAGCCVVMLHLIREWQRSAKLDRRPFL